MNRVPLFLLTFFVFSSPVSADVYLKMRTGGGMGDHETWTKGKMQRNEVTIPMAASLGAGKQIEITRADKGVKWQISHELKAYQETPIPLPYTKTEDVSDEELSDEDAEELKKFQEENKTEDGEAAAPDPCAEVVKSSEEKTFAGIPAEAYQPKCQTAQSMFSRLWIAKAGNAKADRIQKETEAFEKANTESMYSLYPPKEKEQIIKTMTMLGKAMAQGLMGIPDFKDVPLRMMLSMEGQAPGDDGGTAQTMVMLEVVAAEVTPADASLFEIPEGYVKVENLMQLQSQAMISKMAGGDTQFSDVLNGLTQAAQGMGMPASEAEIPMSAEEQQEMNAFAQGTAGFVKDQMQQQGAWEQPSSVPAARNSAPLPTDDPVEPWQQGLYNQNAAQGQAPQQAQYQQGAANPNPYGTRRQQASAMPYANRPAGQVSPQQQALTQNLNQVQQILGQVQQITGQFQGGGAGFIPDSYGGDSSADYYSEESDSEYYEDQYVDDGGQMIDSQGEIVE